ncbi:hypothetical protein Ptr902_10832 [Pyrenophora tritici-repentis]|nr:hypothetical protein Ptr902_10832 [Pyrenophora tritici-repentis]
MSARADCVLIFGSACRKYSGTYDTYVHIVAQGRLGSQRANGGAVSSRCTPRPTANTTSPKVYCPWFQQE